MLLNIVGNIHTSAFHLPSNRLREMVSHVWEGGGEVCVCVQRNKTANIVNVVSEMMIFIFFLFRFIKQNI